MNNPAAHRFIGVKGKPYGRATRHPCIPARADSPNYGIGYATAKSPLGPLEKHPGNPIVKRGGKVLGPGHHCVIEGPDKKLWNVYHQKWDDKINFDRFLAIDPLWFDEQGVIHGKATRETDEPAP